MPGRRIILACCLICFVSSGSREQQPPRATPASDASRTPQPVAPPPKPADDGPSLEVTMKFIQDKLNEVGRLRYSVSWRDDATGDDQGFDAIDELTNAVADAQRCTLSYHFRVEATNVKPLVFDFVLKFKEVNKITVEPAETPLGPGHRVLPPLWMVTVYQNNKQAGWLRIDDEKLANRLAKAINHAVELCTADKKPEPF